MKLKRNVEALLFSSGRKMSNGELVKLCKCSYEDLNAALNELKKEYEEKQSSLMVVEEGDTWKITVLEEHLSLVQNIVTKTELSKTLMETLAVIAFKYPIKQADLIKIRTNKAYDHLNELEEMGYITRQKYSRTKLIRLSQKFFDYFSLPEEKLKEQFKDFNQIADLISEKEKEAKKNKEDQVKYAEDARKEKEEREKLGGIEIEFNDEKVEVYESPKDKPEIEIVGDKLGSLEIVDEQSEEMPNKSEEQDEDVSISENQDETGDSSHYGNETPDETGENALKNEKNIEVKTSDDLNDKLIESEEEKLVDKEVESMLNPPKEEEEDNLDEDKIDEIFNYKEKEPEKKKNDGNNKS